MENQEKQVLDEREQIADIGILDVVDLATLLRVSEQTARRYINEKRVPACKIANGKYLISVDHLKKYIEENAV